MGIEYKLLGALVLVAVLLAAGFGAYEWAYHNGYDAGYAKSQQEQVEVQQAQDAQEITASQALEGEKGKVRTVYRTITKEVERVVEKPVYRNVCIDDDGMRLANAALAGALQPAGQPDSGVPNAGAAAKR